ncbi:DUF1707 SHOCT-like domain-containing protein [Pseudonocardia asaccharolytica]|uniref:DUF1707 domain-containing protein n=1 Tax=Pseudonocardia asaccharolytica DSM 44247 = NBRC 16224 TaxID=1123024 RepID=A0A511D4Y9_9PSEU|nr:DUF1707 domain-containing protein [Pseudonocardia asaccharolytica]GEL19835.1 hypothetical protein PA7_36720 [Pseudonocardia asaccharolytica DSM 44247 = NBRC 16224]
MTTGETAGSGASGPPLRIGNVERESASKALDEHLTAGRLGVEEYADRSAIAANATVASELSALFTDLPEPHPILPGTAVAPAAAAPAPRQAAPERRGFHGWGPRIVAVTPIIALVLFLLLNGVVPYAWVVFLLIPLVGGLVYGNDRHDGRDREERRVLGDGHHGPHGRWHGSDER